MFIYNLNLNRNKISLIVMIIMFTLAIVLTVLGVLKVFNSKEQVKDDISLPKVVDISEKNYTNILRMVHNNPNDYIGQTICFTGYIYRVYDLKDTQFVLARDMVISSDFQTLVVGFLCDYKNAMEYKDYTWVEITGTIAKGNYHGEIPILKISDIKEIEKPVDEYVYPPDDGFLPTSAIL